MGECSGKDTMQGPEHEKEDTYSILPDVYGGDGGFQQATGKCADNNIMHHNKDSTFFITCH